MATVETLAVARRFEHLLLDFLGYLEFERGLSRNTLEAPPRSRLAPAT